MMFQPLDSKTMLDPPRTVDEVVDLLIDDLPMRERITLANLPEGELDASVYLPLAKTIRREFGLYTGNQHLLASCRAYLGREYDRFEDPVMVIVKELWKKIKATHHLRLVK